MKVFALAIILAVMCAFVLVERSSAQSSLVWQTTFNCGDWNQSMGIGESQVCNSGDGISGHGTWATPGHPNGDEITLAANYSGGAGGRGFRHWRADGFDVNGGGIKIGMPSGLTDLWVRFYMRYQAGFAWNPSGSPGFTKDIYALGNPGPDWTFGFHGSGGMWGWTNSGSADTGSIGWTSIMGGATSDGRWHCYEYHVKLGTTTSNGIKEYWVDGNLGLRTTSANTGTSGNWRELVFGSNQNAPANGGDMYTDYDDIAMSASGRIGCLGAAPGPAAPSAPSNLHIIR
jgi:hypothetical protein